MTDEAPRWDLYRSFLAVMHAGSLSAAARELGMTQPSLGRHVRELEARLETPLFTRSPRGLVPTAMARTLLPHAEAMAAATAALQRSARRQGPGVRGVVRIAASQVMGVRVLPAMLARFRRARPGVAVELSLSNRSEDMLRHDADIAVRMRRPQQQALVARRIGVVWLGLYAHAQYLRGRARPTCVADLAAHDVIGFDHEPPYARRLLPASWPLLRQDYALRTDNDLAAMAALQAGFGIGVCQLPLAARERHLVHLLPELAMPMEVWLVMHEDLRRQRAVRALFDHLATALETYVRAV